jgi:hemolysin activation/secretion protein
MISALLLLGVAPPARALGSTPGGEPGTQPQPVAKAMPHFYIQEYQVHGNGHLLTQEEFERAVYPFLGPYRTPDDVEQARAALEKTYKDKGYPFVAVEIPQQGVTSGVIVLQVVKNEVGRLRVHGSRYYSLDEIRREAPSLSEGTVPNFSRVTDDIRTLNELPDRQIAPSVHPGVVPGTVDVDLNVKDTVPVHGSVELNNRYSTGTTALRLNGSIEYDNLWQLGHTIQGSFQLSPEDVTQVKVFSGFYSAHVPGAPWLTVILQGTEQNSNVNTLGGTGVVGTGQTIGGRVVIAMPSKTDFFNSLSLGFDYKHATQDLMTGGTAQANAFNFTPVTYYPVSASYSATWLKKDVGETDLNASVNANMQTISSSTAIFGLNRFGATGSFIYFRGDISHTHELPEGFQAYAKLQGQASGQPLISNEQFSEGGLGTVRGYLESEALGDNGIIGTVEVRTPSLGSLISKSVGQSIDEWRIYAFGDWGDVGINQPLLEQQSTFKLASVGGGMRLRTFSHFNGSIDAALPLDQGPDTNAYSPHLTFRLWADF